MTKLVPILLVAVALVAGGVAAAQLTAGEEPEPRLSLASATVPGTTAETTGTTGTTGEDVSGPCDAAEHANDPRCTGAATTTTRGEDDRGADDRGGSNSGPGGGGDDDNHADDRGGSNSGSGSGDDDGGDDRGGSNSGHGGGDDD